MGHKLSDGKAEQVAVPNGEEVHDGDLYRIGGINGFAIVSGIGRTDATIETDDPDRSLTLETDTNAVWKVKVPASVVSADPDPGDLLYWDDDTATFQDSAVDLLATPGAGTDAPCALVIRKVNTAGYVGVRVLNGVTGL